LKQIPFTITKHARIVVWVVCFFSIHISHSANGYPDTAPLDSESQSRVLEIQDGSDYPGLVSYITLMRGKFQKKYLQAKDKTKKNMIIQEAHAFISEVLIDRIFPAWLGTPWSFNGTTRVPGEGSIACGTFVVYTLQDAGFNIPSKMARQPSENIIKNLIGSKGIKRFSNASMIKVKNWIVENGEGIYIVGLDIHVGFIKYKNAQITFLHSTYHPPLKVVDQEIMESSPLTDSKYRVFGKILNTEMVKEWLTGKQFTLVYDYFDH